MCRQSRGIIFVLMVKLTDRCFCCFTAAMLVPLEGAPTWRFHTKLYKFGWNTFPNNARMKNRTELNLGKVFYVWFIYHIPDSWVNSLNGYDFYFWLRDTANQPYLLHVLQLKATPFRSQGRSKFLLLSNQELKLYSASKGTRANRKTLLFLVLGKLLLIWVFFLLTFESSVCFLSRYLLITTSTTIHNTNK